MGASLPLPHPACDLPERSPGAGACSLSHISPRNNIVKGSCLWLLVRYGASTCPAATGVN